MQGIPHVNNNMFLTGLDLEKRWGISWIDIRERMMRDNLKSITEEDFYKELQGRETHSCNPYTQKMKINPWATKPKEQTFQKHCAYLLSNEVKFLLEAHVWPYEEEHPELKKSAGENYDASNQIDWDHKVEGQKLKDSFNKVPLTMENQQRDMLTFLLSKEGMSLSKIGAFFGNGYENSTVSAWKKSGGLIFEKLRDK